jgi:hypothetical protein
VVCSGASTALLSYPLHRFFTLDIHFSRAAFLAAPQYEALAVTTQDAAFPFKRGSLPASALQALRNIDSKAFKYVSNAHSMRNTFL